MPAPELLAPRLPNRAEAHRAVGCAASPVGQRGEGDPVLSYPLFAYSLSGSALEQALRNNASVRALLFLAGCPVTEGSSDGRRAVPPRYLPLDVPARWLWRVIAVERVNER